MAILLSAVALAVLLALLALQLLNILVAYNNATGTKWQRFLSAFSYSQTIFVARLGAFLAAMSVWLVNFLPYLDPGNPVGQWVQSILPPQYSTFYALGFAVIMELVRRAPGSTDPVTVPSHIITLPAAPPIDVIEAGISALLPKL